MLHFFKRYFAVFASGLAFFLPFWNSPAANDSLYMLNYEDAATSPRAKVVDLCERLKRLTRQSLSDGKIRQKREIFIQLSDGGKHRPFTYRMDRRNNMRIILPETYSKLMAEPGALPRLTGWYLFGHAGKNPEQEKYFRNSWFIVGLSRKLLGEMNSSGTPFSGYFPAAYTLTSASRYPSLQSLLETPLFPDDTTLRLIYEEYCELLVMICSRNGLFRGGLLSRILDELEKSPRRQDMPELFRTHARAILEKRSPKIFPAKLTRQEFQTACEVWFRSELDELLNHGFLPAHAEKVETRYLEAVHFTSPLRKEKTDDPKPPVVQGGLAELIHYYNRLAAPETTVQTIIRRLSKLTWTAPPDLKIPAGNVHNALRKFAEQPSQQSGKQLLKAEQEFFRALERNLVLEDFLNTAERQTVTPGARYYLTFHLIDYDKHPSRQPLPRLTKLLETTEKETQK